MIKLDESLKKEYKLKLQEFENKTFNKSDFIDLELLQAMVDVTKATKLECAVFLTRKNELKNLVVGENDKVNFSVDELVKNRLNGIRIIHTHPNGNGKLSEMDKRALLNCNFDCLCAIGVDDRGLTNAEVGYIYNNDVEIVKVPYAGYINKYGCLEKIEEYNKEYIKNYNTMHNTEKEQNKAILVGVEFSKSDDTLSSLDELENLSKTANIEVLDKVYQKKDKPDGKYLVGIGKLNDIKERVQLMNANLVIFDNELTGSKCVNLEEFLGVKVIDRSMLILDIFASRARTSEGKLQVELAQLKFSLPRLNALSTTHDRFGGGVGMRGPGETKLELNRRIVEKNIIKIEKELKKVKTQRQISRDNRQKNKTTVAIVGYTNSGKSTLLNLLTKANVYEKDELFATLDTTTRNLWLKPGKEILLTDTVGFINKLPHEFIEAFNSTLEETIYADVLIHVVDISNKNYLKQQKIVEDLLKKLKVESPVILVYNKIDKLDEEIEKESGAIYISAKTGKGIENLKNKLLQYV